MMSLRHDKEVITRGHAAPHLLPETNGQSLEIVEHGAHLASGVCLRESTRSLARHQCENRRPDLLHPIHHAH